MRRILEPGAWLIVEGGWSGAQFKDQPGGFTLDELDRAAPNNPFFAASLEPGVWQEEQKAWSESQISLYLNSKALAAVGMTPADGARHPASKLVTLSRPPEESVNPRVLATSTAVPKAEPESVSATVSIPLVAALGAQLPEIPLQQQLQNISDLARTLSASGLTAVYDVGRPSEGNLDLLTQLEAKAQTRLPLRVWHTLRAEAVDQASAAAAMETYRQNKPLSGNERGGLIGLGEHVFLPFYDNPGNHHPLSRRNHVPPNEPAGGSGSERLFGARAHAEQCDDYRLAYSS